MSDHVVFYCVSIFSFWLLMMMVMLMMMMMMMMVVIMRSQEISTFIHLLDHAIIHDSHAFMHRGRDGMGCAVHIQYSRLESIVRPRIKSVWCVIIQYNTCITSSISVYIQVRVLLCVCVFL